jgi:hypothetical protein
MTSRRVQDLCAKKLVSRRRVECTQPEWFIQCEEYRLAVKVSTCNNLPPKQSLQACTVHLTPGRLAQQAAAFAKQSRSHSTATAVQGTTAAVLATWATICQINSLSGEVF